MSILYSLSLDKQIQIHENNIYIPLLCQWYAKDFEFLPKSKLLLVLILMSYYDYNI